MNRFAEWSLGILVSTISFSSIAQEFDHSKTKRANHLVDTSYIHNGTLFFASIPSLQFTGSMELNTVLVSQNAPTLGKFYFMGGLGWEERWKRFSTGIDFLLGGFSNSNNRNELASTLWLANISAKYYVLHRKNIGGVYPFTGITAHNQSVYITDITNTGSMNDLFKQSGSVNMHLSTGFVNFGIGFDLLDFTKEDSFYGSFKLGYRINIGNNFDNQWYVNENRIIEDSPVEKLNAFYIQFAVGYSINHYSQKQKQMLRTY